MVLRRKGEPPGGRHFRSSDRFLMANGAWYFTTREGIDVGPFQTRPDAVKACDRLIELLRTVPIRTKRENDRDFSIRTGAQLARHEGGTMQVDISGTCAATLSAVKDAFAANFTEHGDVGASVAVVKDGELVVDLWGGHQDVNAPCRGRTTRSSTYSPRRRR